MDRIVHLTTEETDKLLAVLRSIKSEAAIDATHMLGLRLAYAQAEEFDAEDVHDDARDDSTRFGNVRSYPGMSGVAVQSSSRTGARHMFTDERGNLNLPD